jgi:hypothetical protein
MPAGEAHALNDSFSSAIVSATVSATASATANASVTIPKQPQTAYPRFYQQYFAEPERRWQFEVQTQLLKYIQMKQGWNGYSAPAPNKDTAEFALVILNKIMRSLTPIPHVVPSSSGGIQLEWHEKDVDLELHVSAPYEFEMWFRDHRQKQPPISLELSSDFAPLLAPIKLLTTR